jgi:hypothetical protein
MSFADDADRLFNRPPRRTTVRLKPISRRPSEPITNRFVTRRNLLGLRKTPSERHPPRRV